MATSPWLFLLCCWESHYCGIEMVSSADHWMLVCSFLLLDSLWMQVRIWHSHAGIFRMSRATEWGNPNPYISQAGQNIRASDLGFGCEACFPMCHLWTGPSLLYRVCRRFWRALANWLWDIKGSINATSSFSFLYTPSFLHAFRSSGYHYGWNKAVEQNFCRSWGQFIYLLFQLL